MNVATKPIQAGDLCENVIYEAIREMQGSFDEKKRNTQAISEKIRNEGGVAEAVRLIDMNIKESIDATRKGFEDSFFLWLVL